MTPTEALAQIKALCDTHFRSASYYMAGQVRAVLAQVQVQAEPFALDRGAVLDAIVAVAPEGMELRYDGTEEPTAAAYVAGVQAAHDAARDALEACVRPSPLQAIDRDALVNTIEQAFFEDGVALTSAYLAADRILALLRPVDGPPQTVDRVALMQELSGFTFTGSAHDVYRLADRILALLRPVEGVVLTREEAVIALSWYPGDEYAVSLRHVEVAERLDAAS